MLVQTTLDVADVSPAAPPAEAAEVQVAEQRLHVEDLQSTGEKFDGPTVYARTKRAQVMGRDHAVIRFPGGRATLLVSHSLVGLDDYDEVLFYHDGDFFSRDHIEAGIRPRARSSR